MKLCRLLIFLFLFMPIQSISMDYNEGPESEVYTVNDGNVKITATRFKKDKTFFALKRDGTGNVEHAKNPEVVFRSLELIYA